MANKTRPAGFYFVRWEDKRKSLFRLPSEEWDIVELVEDDFWFSTATTARSYDDDFAEIGPRVQTPEEIAAAIDAMREACACLVEDVENDAGPLTVADRIRTLMTVAPRIRAGAAVTAGFTTAQMVEWLERQERRGRAIARAIAVRLTDPPPWQPPEVPT